jgi:small subunit ribosomal protein S20
MGPLKVRGGALVVFEGSKTISKAFMANIKSQKKRNLTNEKRRLRNKAVRSELKTRVKVAKGAVTDGADGADEMVRTAQRRLAKAASKGHVHKRQAARRTSRLMKSAAKANATD